LERIHEADARASEQAGYDKIEPEWQAIVDKQAAAEMRILETKPTSRAGAIELLRFVAEDLRRFSGHDAEVEAAILNAVSFLEGEARA
jgi:hypothetical protein